MNTNRMRIIPGLILVALGVLFLVVQYFELSPGLILIFFGLIFLAGFAALRSYGLLIPGCILAGLGLGLLFGRAPLREDATTLLGLGVGFVAIFVVQLIVAGKSHWWPLVPGILLVLAGLAESFPQGQVLFEKGWPLALILIGLLVLLGQFWGSRSGKTPGLGR